MSRCYVGSLPKDVIASDLVAKFEKIGNILDVSLKKTVSDETYAFIHFEDKDAAAVAVKEFDDSELLGHRLRVELPFEKRSRDNQRDSQRSSVRSYSARGDSSSVPSRLKPRYCHNSRGRYTIYVSNLPTSGSWQDLKDHFREAGECDYADVGTDGSGVVEYNQLDDARHAMRVCRSKLFQSHEGESTRIKLFLEDFEPRRSAPYSRGGERRPPRSPRKATKHVEMCDGRSEQQQYSPRESALI